MPPALCFNGQNIAANNPPHLGAASYDKERWKLAADAARELIGENKFSLPNFKDVFITQNNSEILFFRQGGNNTEIEKDQWARWFCHYGAGPYQSTQELVDAFPTNTGLPITDPASGYNSSNPYANRDPRLTMSIMHNGITLAGR